MSPVRRPRVLLVEDSPSLAQVYLAYLRNEPYEIRHAETGSAALASMEERIPDAMLLDLKLPDMDGLDILKLVASQRLPTVVVVVTAHGSVDVAVEAMRLGAFDFLVKPIEANRLKVTARNALDRRHLEDLVETFREDSREHYYGFIGASLPMQAVYRIIDSAAPSKATVFITGESGTGKEVCAEAIHRHSPRSDKPFVAINCGAIPKDLMESEIFGHVKGAFTGALAARDGAASRADGGTLFLDEICEMDFDLQTKLLRFVQTGTFQKVGGSRMEKVDVRFICATNRDPLQEVENGRFREDLYYRVHVIPIGLPPLRERDTDVIAIARHFLVEYAREESKRFKRFAAETELALLSYQWPGNVRQLQNVIRNVVVLNDAEEVLPAMLPPPLDAVSPGARPAAELSPAASGGEVSPTAVRAQDDVVRPLWLVEREVIEHAITQCDGNIPKAAALLGISASTIYRKRQVWEAGGGPEAD